MEKLREMMHVGLWVGESNLMIDEYEEKKSEVKGDDVLR